MKLAFVTATLTSGGSERVISILANKLSERGHEVEIICYNKHIVFYPINSSVKIVFAEEECKSSNIIKKMIWLRRHIIQEKPEIVIPFMVAVYSCTLIALLGCRIPVLSSVRNDPRLGRRIYKFARRTILPLSTHIVVQTKHIKDYFPKKLHDKITIIYNPVNDRIFDVLSNNYSKQNRIISVGRLFPQKNQKMMICAFSKIASEFTNWKLVLFGEGPLRPELENLIKEKNMTGRIELPGRSEMVLEEVAKSKLFCMSSYYEGMSNAMIEAICLGLPIISTKVSGTEELVQDGYNGYLLEDNDIDGLAYRFKEMMSHEENIHLFGQRNREQVYKFKTEAIVNQWENLIKKVVKSKVKVKG